MEKARNEMRKCNVCGRRFRLRAKNRYEVVKRPVGLNCLTQETVYFNAFDCPHCGCQNIVGVIEKVNRIDNEEQPQESEE
jgi:transcription elongation factor Elf1